MLDNHKGQVYNDRMARPMASSYLKEKLSLD